VSLIVSAPESQDALDLAFATIERQTCPPIEVVVADHSDDNQIAQSVSKWSARFAFDVQCVRDPKQSRSRAPVLNRALRAATGDYVVFVDGDCLLNPHFIEDHQRHARVQIFLQGCRAGVRARYVRRLSAEKFRPMTWFLRRRIYGLRQGLRLPWAIITRNDHEAIHGYNFAVWRKDLLRVNGFDEAFDESGREMAELAERLRNAGLTLHTITGQAVVYHLDHRRIAHYHTQTSERILERTRREKIIRCEQGLSSDEVTPAAPSNSSSHLHVAPPAHAG
jgi:glycosyltransferase involved in cell wall biosynthesis